MSGKIGVVILSPTGQSDGSLMRRAINYIKKQTIADEIAITIAESDPTEFASEINFALEDDVLADSEYIIFHEFSNFWEMNGMERIRGAIEAEYPFVWGLFMPSFVVDEAGKVIVASDPIDGLTAERVTGQMEFTKMTGNTVNLSAAIVRTKALRTVEAKDGYILDEKLKFHWDWDLWLRFLKYGGKMVFKEGEPVSNWFDGPFAFHKHPLFFLYKQMVYSRIRAGFYD